MTNPLQKLPSEIRRMIFREVLYNPAANVILGNDEFEQVRPRQVFPEVLRTCHEYYHEGREFLFQNEITFSREGGELLDVIKPLGVLSCCTPDCPRYGEIPKLRHARFLLGDNSSSSEGSFYTKSFRNNLIQIRGPIEIGALTIELKMFCWAASNQPWMFCHALERIVLKKQLTMAGIGCYDEALTMDPGNMKGILCLGKPHIRVIEPAYDLIAYLNLFACSPIVIATENAEDIASTIRENMMTFSLSAAGSATIINNDVFVHYWAARYQYGDLRGIAVVVIPPLVLALSFPWHNSFSPPWIQSQQGVPAGYNGGGQMLPNAAYILNAPNPNAP